MATGTLIRHAQFKKHYDAIIIGSGISGLAAAASLAKSGQ